LLAFCVVGSDLRTHQAAWIFSALIVAASMPHYGATLVRVYEHARERSRYRHFTVHATLALLAVVLVSLRAPIVGCWLATLYVNWSPWHYAGQNYGLAVMFLRRRGIDPTPHEKRMLWLSFVVSTGIAFLTLNVDAYGPSRAGDSLLSGGSDIHLLSLRIPVTLVAPLGLLCVGSYLATLGTAVVSLLQRARPRTLAPTLVLVVSQALWFSLPLGLHFLPLRIPLDPFRPEFRDYYFVWIALAHAVQYLWVTAYFARASSNYTGLARYYGKTLLAGCSAWAFPIVLLAPLVSSSISYDSGLALLVAAAVNVHHFVLDGAIWKLRGGRVARVLIRSVHDEEGAPPAPKVGLHALAPRFVWAVLAVGFAIQAFVVWQRDGAVPSAMGRHDYDAAAAALDRLAWIGYDDAGRRTAVGMGLGDAQRPSDALIQLERSIKLRPTVPALAAVGDVHARQGNWVDARAAFERAIALDPRTADLYAAAGKAALASGDVAGARALVEQADRALPVGSPSLENLRRELAASSSEQQN
jgi:tetratricopeptide (TPR) repeat protein